MALRKVGPVGYVNSKSYPVEGAISRGYGVKVGVAEGNVQPVSVAGDQGIGLAAEDQPTVGGPLQVIRDGDAVAIAGVAANQGQYVKFNAQGQVIPVAGPAGSGEQVIGRLESNPTQQGDECIVFVSPFVY